MAEDTGQKLLVGPHGEGCDSRGSQTGSVKSESCDLETATIAMGMKHEGENKVTENLYVGPSPP